MGFKMKSKLFLFILYVIIPNLRSTNGSLNQPLQISPPLLQARQAYNQESKATNVVPNQQSPPIQPVPTSLNVLPSHNSLQPLIQATSAIAPKLTQQAKTISNESFQLKTALQSPKIPPILMPTIGQDIKSQIVGNNQAGQILNSKSTAIINTNVEQANYGNSEDPIQYLDYSSMNDEILKRKTANFVYFNANFNHCRHCNKLFNIWKELAIDIRWWGQVIKLFSINCSDEDNLEVCRRAGVTQFPQVRYYWCMSDSLERDGQRLRVLGKSVHAMRHLIMDKVLDSYIEHNKILAQMNRQKAPSQSSNNLVSGNGIATGGIGGGQSSTLSSLMSMPLISQLFNVGNSNSNPNSGSKMSSLINLFLGGKNDGNTASSSSGTNNLQLSNLIGSTGINLAPGSGSNHFMNALLSVNSMLPQKITQPLGNNWPELESFEIDDAQQLVNMLPLDVTKNIGALLIMETQEFLYTGVEVMLDLNPYANQTYIARVRDEKSQLSRNLTKRDDIQAPAIIYVTPSCEVRLIMTAPKYTNDEDLRRAFVRAFERRQIKYPVKRVWSIASQSAVSKTSGGIDSQEDEELLSKINQVYMSDLTNAIRASLMEQIFRQPDLSDDQYNALVKYVYTLINYFPFNSDESLKFFRRLHAWLQNQVFPMDINEYKKQFHDVDEVFQQREWVACKSMSNTKAITNKANKKPNSLFENPAQFGKVVSNITRFLRGHQQQTSKFKSLFNMFTSGGSTSPVMLNQNQNQNPSAGHGNSNKTPAQHQQAGNNTGGSSQRQNDDTNRETDSPIERIIKSLTSGSMGSDSSILKLISTALTGNTNSDSSTFRRSKFAREYPCGIWKLAHVMVVNEYIKDSPRKDVKHIVLHCLYQYMLQFYACPTCGNRVSDVSGEFRLNLDEHLQDQGDSVLLLWKVHNRVNKRLESELRPGSPAKIQFPTESLCPKCRAPRAQADLISTPNWHEKQVLNFLVHHYRPQSIITNSSSSPHASSSASSSTTTTISLVMNLNVNIDIYPMPIASSFLILLIVNYCSSSIVNLNDK